jgi:flagellar protein FliS
MYTAQPRLGAARMRYQDVELRSRTESASPHGLVALMFDELLKALDAMAAACKRGDYAQRAARQARALSILNGLQVSLDYEKGGEIAASLGTIYKEAHRLTLLGGKENDAELVLRAREIMHDIATAWEAIG